MRAQPPSQQAVRHRLPARAVFVVRDGSHHAISQPGVQHALQHVGPLRVRERSVVKLVQVHHVLPIERVES